MLQFFVSLWFKLEVLLYVITMQKKKKKKRANSFFPECTTRLYYCNMFFDMAWAPSLPFSPKLRTTRPELSSFSFL